MSTTKRQEAEVAPDSALPGSGRWSSKRKTSVILEMLRGADLEATSRKHRVTIATLTEWRDRFLLAGETSLKSRETDAEDEENRRLKSVVANISIENELLREKISRLESNRPLAQRKSKP
jgi:transposase